MKTQGPWPASEVHTLARLIVEIITGSYDYIETGTVGDK
jgi:hypothetical protein